MEFLSHKITFISKPGKTQVFNFFFSETRVSKFLPRNGNTSRHLSFCEVRQRLHGIYGRYAMHKLSCIVVLTLLGVYDVIVTKIKT